MTLAQAFERRGYQKAQQENEQRLRDLALQLMPKGMSPQEISDLTKLPIETVRKLAN